MPSNIETNLADIRSRIASAAKLSGRDGSEVKLVAVSKTHPPAVLRQALAAGAWIFGENKVQEAEVKILDLGRNAAEWHLIGHLQSNKARKAVQLFDVIHSLDSFELAERLERICIEEDRARLSVFIHLDLAGEETKSGIALEKLPKLVDILSRCERLSLDGLMTLPPYFENANDVRPFFQRLREIRDQLKAAGAFQNGTGELSMGMSHDFEIAIEEGATVVRVGTAIFGGRS